MKKEENDSGIEEVWVEEDDPIEKEEMWDAPAKMKLGKSAAYDGTSEMLS